YDEHGNPLPQIGIDIELTKAIGAAIKPMGVKIAQHGITGTPLEIIATEFPKEFLGKGNVGTNWMTIAWDVLKLFEPELYNTIHGWTINNHHKENVPINETFLKYSKLAIIEHFNEIYAVKKETEHALKQTAYASALFFLKAFDSYSTTRQF
ncbi:MAG: class II fructose-bisphosphate aldolase, partial [Candidatus Hodarchaeales archaeon]